MIKKVMGGRVLQFGNWFYCYWESRMCWFRLFGYGLHIKDKERYPLIYSERNGWGKTIGNWHIKYLRHGR